MKKQKNFKTQRGITLVALIITIIVLVILAAVAINVALNTGIINFATKGVKDYAEAGVEENRVMNKAIDFMESTTKKIEGILGGNGGGDQNALTTVADAISKETTFSETTKITDDDNKEMWVPKDFTVTEGDKIDDGVVVKDSQGNEFVWVPVDNINDMVMCQTHGAFDKDTNSTGGTITYENRKFICDKCGDSEPILAGKLYATNTGNDFGTVNTKYTEGSGLREPDIVTEYDTDDKLSKHLQPELTQDQFKTQLQNEFNEMAKSVAEYGGFYIGRYETSGLEKNGTPIVQKDKEPTVEWDWYTMYKNSKNLAKAGSKVTSSMIWGCQWDAVMNWMKDIKNPTITDATKYYITDSSGMGWHREETGYRMQKTGVDLTNDKYPGVVLNRVKNIYDLAGNVYEWTLEADDLEYSRVIRGSGCRCRKQPISLFSLYVGRFPSVR